jgi:ABC-2 type transport system permease protein
MKHNFSGWTSVYGFTLRQSTKGVAFKLITALISLVIIGVIVTITLLNAKPEDNKPENADASPINKVFVLDNSGLQPTDFKALNTSLQSERFQNIEYIQLTEQSRDTVVKTAGTDSDSSIAVIITTTDSGYELEAVIPSGSIISSGQANTVVQEMSVAFNTNKLLQSGLTSNQLSIVMTPAVTSYSTIGVSSSGIAYAIKLIAPMLFAFMLYMMLILYGQTISKSVSTEKTSRLMETLLTSIHPYALISGKILAVTSMALLQFVTWIASIFIGLYGADAIAHVLYPDYTNSVITVIDFLKDNIGETALSPAAIILAITFFCVGFLFYCVIAGLAGCMVSKPEDVASSQQLFMFPIIISFLVAYMAPIYHNEALVKVARYIPFTAPFSVPSDLITGTIGLGEGILTLAVLCVFCLLIMMLSGRLYKGLILYSGQKPNFKMIGNVLKGTR